MPEKIEISLYDYAPKQKNSFRHRFYISSTQILSRISDAIGISSFFTWLFYFNLDDHIKNERIKAFLRFITLSSKPEDPSLSTSKDIPHTDAIKNQKDDLSLFHRSIFSGNTLIAALGLNFAYVVVHLVTLWTFHAVWLTAATIGLIALPIVVYMGLAISDAINAVKRNLIYEERKKNKIEKINKLKAKLRPLVNSTEFKLSFQPSEHYLALTKFLKTQAFFEALKKFTRTTMLFTIIFALEMATGVPLEFLISSIVSGVLILAVDWRAQQKESKHELKLREMHEHIVVLTQEYVKRMKNTQQSVISNTAAETQRSVLLTQLLHPPLPAAPVKESWFRRNIFKRFNTHLLAWDNVLAIIGITSAYVAYGFITTFNIHLADLLANALLFSIPGGFALLIVIANVYINYKLHQSYIAEEARLNAEISELRNKTRDIINNYSFDPAVVEKLTNYLARNPNDLWTTHYCQENKKWYKEREAFKKFSRILTMAFLFLGASTLLTPAGIVAVIALALIIAGLDYIVRKGKEEKENQLKALQTEQLKLLKVQEILVENFAKTAGKAIKLDAGSPSLGNAPSLTLAAETNHSNGNSNELIAGTTTPTIAIIPPATTSTLTNISAVNTVTTRAARAARPPVQPAVVVPPAVAATNNNNNDPTPLSTTPATPLLTRWHLNQKSKSNDNYFKYLQHSKGETNNEEFDSIQILAATQDKVKAPYLIIDTKDTPKTTTTPLKDNTFTPSCHVKSQTHTHNPQTILTY